MTSKKRKAEILELYKSMPDTEKVQFNIIRTARHAKIMRVNIWSRLLYIFIFISTVALIFFKPSFIFVPFLAILFVFVWNTYSINIIDSDAQKSWVATLNLPKYYDIVKIIREIPSDDVKTKKEGRP
jgi:hypothetical protein